MYASTDQTTDAVVLSTRQVESQNSAEFNPVTGTAKNAEQFRALVEYSVAMAQAEARKNIFGK